MRLGRGGDKGGTRDNWQICVMRHFLLEVHEFVNKFIDGVFPGKNWGFGQETVVE
jgi:hypothetical protein